MFGPVVTVIALVAILILVFAACDARRGDERGARLLKLVTRGVLCIAVVFLVFSCFVYPPIIICSRHPVRNRTTAIHHALMAGLENYHSEFGEFPQPVRQGKTVVIDGQTYDVDSALMLYQAMTGDGTDAIVMKNNDKASDGRFDNDGPSRAMLTDMPKEMWKHTPAGYIIVDAFGHPFQYDPASPTSVDVVNLTYDLWSFGEAPPVKATKAVRQDPAATAKWIKNF